MLQNNHIKDQRRNTKRSSAYCLKAREHIIGSMVCSKGEAAHGDPPS